MKRLLRIASNSAIISFIPIISWLCLGLLVDKNLVNVFTLTYSLQFILELLKSIFATPYCTGIGQVTSSLYQFLTVNIMFNKNFAIDKTGKVLEK